MIGSNVALDSRDSGAMTPAHQAVELGQLDELTRLLDAGSDPNEVWSNMTLLLHAIDMEADGAAQTGQPLDAACTAGCSRTEPIRSAPVLTGRCHASSPSTSVTGSLSG